jgi:ribosome-associated translation inhibitor RaiA
VGDNRMAELDFEEVPIQVVGLQKDDIESRKAELKFQRSLQAFGRVHRDIIEARAIVKTSVLEKERRRFEVQVFIKLPKEQVDFSEEGWSIEEVFEKISEKIKRLMTKPRDKASHRRHPSRMEIESSRYAE